MQQNYLKIRTIIYNNNSKFVDYLIIVSENLDNFALFCIIRNILQLKLINTVYKTKVRFEKYVTSNKVRTLLYILHQFFTH